MSAQEYTRLVVAISIWITLSAGWLAMMMAVRMAIIRYAGPPDIAAFLYVISTAGVFAIIALRYGAMAPMWLVILLLTAKALACTGVAFWAWRRMRKEKLK